MGRTTKLIPHPGFPGLAHIPGVMLTATGQHLNKIAWGSAQIAEYARQQYQLSTAGARIGGSSPDAAKVEAAYVGFGTMLHNRIMADPSGEVRSLVTTTRTNQLLTREIWLNANPRMRVWEGDKVLSQLTAETLSIVTRPYEASVMIPKGDIINDQLGLYASRINGLGECYNQLLNEVAVVMLIAGLQGTALGATYDGQNLIDTDHTALGSGVGAAQSNRVTGAFSSAVYQAAWNLFMSMKTDKGLPANTAGRPLTLLHGPANRVAVRNVLAADAIAGASTTNLDKGTAMPLCSPWISAGAQYSMGGATITLTGLEWFLIPADSAAVIMQIKREPEFLSVEDGEMAFRTGKYLYGVECEVGAAYGSWQEIVGGPGA